MRQAVRIKLLIKGNRIEAESAATSHGIRELGDVTQTKCKDDSFFCEGFVDEAYGDAIRLWFAAADHQSLVGYDPGDLLWYAPQHEEQPESEPVASHLPIACLCLLPLFFPSEAGQLLGMAALLFSAAYLARHIRDARGEGSLRSARWYFRHANTAQPKLAPLVPPPLSSAQMEALRRWRDIDNSRRPWGRP
jgi:hypothetical protein